MSPAQTGWYLDHCGEDVSEGNENKVIQGSGVGNLWEVLPSLQTQEGHGEDSGDP